MSGEPSTSATEQDGDGTFPRPWSTRRPQNFILSAALIVLGIALAIQGFVYVGQGVGGAIPYLLILLGPALAIYYTWYFTIRDPEAKAD
jgi:hypothetical protein